MGTVAGGGSTSWVGGFTARFGPRRSLAQGLAGPARAPSVDPPLAPLVGTNGASSAGVLSSTHNTEPSVRERIPVVTDAGHAQPFARLDHREVDPDRQVRQPRAVGQGLCLAQPADGRPEVISLTPVERLLAQTECPAGPPADLDHDQRRRRPGVDREEIHLVSPEPEVPAEHAPAGGRELFCYGIFGRVAQSLGWGPKR